MTTISQSQNLPEIDKVSFHNLSLPSNELYQMTYMSELRSDEFEDRILQHGFKKIGFQDEFVMYQKGECYMDDGSPGRLTIYKSQLSMDIKFEWQYNAYDIRKGSPKDYYQTTLDKLTPYYNKTDRSDEASMLFYNFPIEKTGSEFVFTVYRRSPVTIINVMRIK